ncbi:hypothetical protein WR25_09564 [Diploscapter pachys]|uniref:NR LBD domain-containing protein n=1 Tax=Diploscapter pachys TaxID=2018661 RepID=A0A2A2KXK5_9BILA|nr:hypothetical protein WR25_09564 [Diploscapter pachys]
MNLEMATETFRFSAYNPVPKKVPRLEQLLFSSNLLSFGEKSGVSWFSYEVKSDHMRYPDGTNYIFKEKGLEKLVDSGIVNMIVNKVTKTEYVLLKAIVLANPAVPGLSYKAHDILNKERLRFTRALLHHCLCERGSSVGAARFGTLLGILQHYEHIVKKQKDFHIFFRMEVPPPYRIPLIEDVMD